MRIEEVHQSEVPMHLLLLADPSEDTVSKYLDFSRCFLAYCDKKAVGVCIIRPIGDNSFEIMNIAVAPSNQRNGIGTQLINHVIERTKEKGAHHIEVGTGTFGYPLAFYQKHGFRATHIDKDFFLNNYSEPIMEDGIQHKDMLRLTLEFNEHQNNSKRG